MAITLLRAIYEIRETAISNKISPCVNLFANETQHAYKANKSKDGGIFFTKKGLVKKTISGEIPMGVSKDCDRIGGGKLWGNTICKGTAH